MRKRRRGRKDQGRRGDREINYGKAKMPWRKREDGERRGEMETEGGGEKQHKEQGPDAMEGPIPPDSDGTRN